MEQKLKEIDVFLRQDWEHEAQKDLIFLEEKTNLEIGEARKAETNVKPIIEVNEEIIRDYVLPF